MTFTIHVPIFPRRKDSDDRRERKGVIATLAPVSRHRPRDDNGFLELELLPLDELDAVESATAKARRRARRS